jgi:hypothetical protein
MPGVKSALALIAGKQVTKSEKGSCVDGSELARVFFTGRCGHVFSLY